MSSLPRVFSFWSGPVSWFEQLSALSAIRAGHDLTVFSYGPPDPAWRDIGVRVEPADTLWELRTEYDHVMKLRKPAFLSDHLRLEGLARRYGIWMDLDCMLIRPIPFAEHLYAWEKPACAAGYVGNAVLHLPTDCPALLDMLAFLRRRPFKPVPAHLAPMRRWRRHVTWYWDRLVRPHRIKTVLGPDLLTGTLGRFDLLARARHHRTFYPFAQVETARALIPGAMPADFGDADDVVMIHMWCKRGGLAGPLSGSWLGDLARAVDMPLAPLDDHARACVRGLEARLASAGGS